jgi:hypothetical protein
MGNFSAFFNPPSVTDRKPGCVKAETGYRVGYKCCAPLLNSGNIGFIMLFCSYGNVSAALLLPNKVVTTPFVPLFVTYARRRYLYIFSDQVEYVAQ